VIAIIRPETRPSGARFPLLVIFFSLILLMMMLAYSLLDNASSAYWLGFWGVTPANLFVADSIFQLQTRRIWTLFTALLVHTSWFHLIGNLAYLWVFGLSVERRLGHWYFLIAFAVLGALANYWMAVQNVALDQPIVGASGAVSAMIGIYLGLFPTGRIGLWIPLGLYLQFARIPAWLVIGSWFTLQLIYTVFGPDGTTVAWWAHLAGFIAGLSVALLIRLLSFRAGRYRHSY